jgi:ammonium transporter, Amt family
MPVNTVSTGAYFLALGLIFLVPCAAAGLALIGTGLGRSRSAAHAMMSSLCVLAVAALAYFFCGYAWQSSFGGPTHSVIVGGKEWSLLGAGRFFMHAPAMDSAAVPVGMLLGVFSVGIAALIPLGAGADRWRLGACCVSTAVLAGWTYPLFAHWVWGGGWLARLGGNYGLGYGFLDTGGSGTIQTVGGLSALSIAWLLGSRHGKYTREGLPTAIPGHNGVLVMLGCLFSLVGWMALNSAGALVYYNIAAWDVGIVAMNTLLSACTAALAAALVTRIRFGKPDLSLSANGFVGGLAASSAACAFVIPAEAVVIGAIAGVLVTFSVEWFELHMSVDDPGGSISAHAMGGLWGVLAAGVFYSHYPLPNDLPGSLVPRPPGQWLAQLVGIATLLGFVLPLTYGLNWLIDRIIPHRVHAEGERQGMDLYELGAGAYPEFIVHSDEFIER